MKQRKMNQEAKKGKKSGTTLITRTLYFQVLLSYELHTRIVLMVAKWNYSLLSAPSRKFV